MKVPIAALRYSPQTDDLRRRKTYMSNPGERSAVIWLEEDKNSIKPVDVVTGEDDGTSIAILEGDIRKGDRVIVSEVNPSRPTKLFGIRLGF